MNDVNGYYSCSINPTYISTWFTPFTRKSKNDNAIMNFGFSSEAELKEKFGKEYIGSKKPANFADNQHHGKISIVAMKKIKKAIDYAVFLAAPKEVIPAVHGKNFTFRLNFITLTLSAPQCHSDNDIKKNILQPMLNCFRQKYGVINYIWRGEKQANGNLHFHIITDKFIAWNNLRNDWNKYQQNLGYITKYRENMQLFHANGFNVRQDLLKNWCFSAQKSAYVKGINCGWDNPNSTDIHSLVHISNVKNYFVKYLTKDTQSLDLTGPLPNAFANMSGRLWGCSSNLANIKGARADLDNQLQEELQKITDNVNIKSFSDTYHSVSIVNIEYLTKLGLTIIPNLFEAFIKLQFPAYRPENLFSAI